MSFPGDLPQGSIGILGEYLADELPLARSIEGTAPSVPADSLVNGI